MRARIQLPHNTTTAFRGAPSSTPPFSRCVPSRCTFSTTVSRRADDAPLDDNSAESARIAGEYRQWLAGPAKNFKKPLFNETNYVSSYDTETWARRNDPTRMDQPFPLNSVFKSTPVLSDELRNEIYRRVMERGMSVRNVSAELGVSLERVAAVVRLKAVEQEWIKQEKPLATFATKALHSMMPVTPLHGPNQEQIYHESIQDMPSHPFSHRQAFIPVSESRPYTRADAGEEFGLPPTEEAVPHPQLVILEKEKSEGLSRDERVNRQIQRDNLEKETKAEEAAKVAERESATRVVQQGRWNWRLKPVETGRVGFRYGVPHQDRKKGQVKIPKRVE